MDILPKIQDADLAISSKQPKKVKNTANNDFKSQLAQHQSKDKAKANPDQNTAPSRNTTKNTQTEQNNTGKKVAEEGNQVSDNKLSVDQSKKAHSADKATGDPNARADQSKEEQDGNVVDLEEDRTLALDSVPTKDVDVAEPSKSSDQPLDINPQELANKPSEEVEAQISDKDKTPTDEEDPQAIAAMQNPEQSAELKKATQVKGDNKVASTHVAKEASSSQTKIALDQDILDEVDIDGADQELDIDVDDTKNMKSNFTKNLTNGQGNQSVVENKLQSYTQVQQTSSTHTTAQVKEGATQNLVQQMNSSGERFQLDMNKPGWEKVSAERLVMMVQKNQQKATIEIDPPELGPIHVKISVHGQDVNLNFQAAHPTTRDLLEAQAEKLRNDFSDSGFSLNDFDVHDDSFQQGDSDEPSANFVSNGQINEGVQPEQISIQMQTPHLLDLYI